jgi:hypothetical protein
MGVDGSEASRGGRAVDVGMMLELLVPGMEHEGCEFTCFASVYTAPEAEALLDQLSPNPT